GFQGFERVVILILAARAERGEKRGPERAHLLAPIPVADRVLHDAMEEQRQLGRRALAVLLREAQHRVLHDVERRFLVAHGKHGLLERSALDALQERRKLAAGCQGSLSGALLFCRCMVPKSGCCKPPFGLTAPHQPFIVQGFSAFVTKSRPPWTASRRAR